MCYAALGAFESRSLFLSRRKGIGPEKTEDRWDLPDGSAQAMAVLGGDLIQLI